MVYCEIYDRCIAGYVRMVYYATTALYTNYLDYLRFTGVCTTMFCGLKNSSLLDEQASNGHILQRPVYTALKSMTIPCQCFCAMVVVYMGACYVR